MQRIKHELLFRKIPKYLLLLLKSELECSLLLSIALLSFSVRSQLIHYMRYSGIGHECKQTVTRRDALSQSSQTPLCRERERRWRVYERAEMKRVNWRIIISFTEKVNNIKIPPYTLCSQCLVLLQRNDFPGLLHYRDRLWTCFRRIFFVTSTRWL